MKRRVNKTTFFINMLTGEIRMTKYRPISSGWSIINMLTGEIRMTRYRPISPGWSIIHTSVFEIPADSFYSTATKDHSGYDIFRKNGEYFCTMKRTKEDNEALAHLISQRMKGIKTTI